MAKRGDGRSNPSAATTGLEQQAQTAPAGRRFLLVTAQGSMRVHLMPDEGEIIVGRGRECQVVLDHPSISRQHARLRVDTICSVADLGSRNGTMFRGERLLPGEERQLAAGESFSVGGISLLVIPPGGERQAMSVAGSRLRVDDPTDAGASDLLVAVARAPVNVVIYGETGVGKELLAETLHRLSGRPGQLFGINCAALAEPLLESELFGYERGAFTGAVQSKPGLLQAASGGTILLDEIGDMSPGVQAKLLRAIETRTIMRLGGIRPVPIDVRFVAATHRDLLALSERGGFRPDLYYRLAGFALEIPPLREHKDRITALAAKILAESAARNATSPPGISAAASAALTDHAWPGNVRELRNVIERAVLVSRGGEIGAEHVIFDATDAKVQPSGPDERSQIEAALEACAGNQTRAAQMLRMSRTTFVQRLRQYGIARPRPPR